MLKDFFLELDNFALGAFNFLYLTVYLDLLESERALQVAILAGLLLSQDLFSGLWNRSVEVESIRGRHSLCGSSCLHHLCLLLFFEFLLFMINLITNASS